LLLPDPSSWDIVILGTDINEQALAQAVQGIYSSWSFRLMDPDLRDIYFQRQHNGWTIAEGLRRMVSFQYGNVLEPGLASVGGRVGDFDLLVCRNVFIYFESNAVARVVQGFRGLLAPGGILLAGHAELYGHELEGFRSVLYPEALIYKKEVRSATHGPTLPPVRPLEERNKPKASPLPGTAPPQRRAAVGEGTVRGESGTTDQLQRKAQAHADAGNYAEARLLCRQVIFLDANSADPFFLLAHVAEAAGNDEEAKEFLKKAIYLQPSFVAAYCELGSLYDKENDDVHARKVRTSAMSFLKGVPFHAPVPPYQITAGELRLHLEKLTAAGPPW